MRERERGGGEEDLKELDDAVLVLLGFVLLISPCGERRRIEGRQGEGGGEKGYRCSPGDNGVVSFAGPRGGGGRGGGGDY